MKQEHIIQAEQEARQACEGLGHTEEQIQAFIEEHIGNEARREAQKEDELARPKRNAALTNAIIHAAVDPFRRARAEDLFPAFNGKRTKSDFEMEQSRWDDKRNRGET